MSVILGVNCYHADSSACLFIDGKMISAVEEERFSRIKHLLFKTGCESTSSLRIFVKL